MGEAKTETPEGYLAINTFGCPALAVYADDYFNDWFGRFYAGTHKDTPFVVTDFTQVGGVTTFSPGLSVKTDATDLFELLPPDFSTEEINDAINSAISLVEKDALEDKVDNSIQIVASVYEYPIPDSFLYISEVYQEESTTGRYSPSAGRVDARHWEILHGSPAKLWFNHSWVSLTAGRHLRLVGQKKPGQLTLDADLCNISPTFLVYQAKAHLHFSRVNEEGDNHFQKMVVAQSRADAERVHIRVAGQGRKVSF